MWRSETNSALKSDLLGQHNASGISQAGREWDQRRRVEGDGAVLSRHSEAR